MSGRERTTGVRDKPSVWVRVPASTSNLGPGFDVLGLALDLFLTAHFTPGGEALALERSGTLAELSGHPDDDLLFRALADTWGEVAGVGATLPPQGSALPPGRIVVESEIPVGKGLGSSAAAITAGRILGLLLADRPVEPGEVVTWVANREGHPDNAAPAALGGFVAAVLHDGRCDWAELPLADSLGWAYAAPPEPLETGPSRGALPASVPHALAVRNAARLARLLPALASGEGEVLAEAMSDELHVPHRIPLIRGAAEAVAAGVAAGAWAVTLSGAGSGLIAVAPPEAAEGVARAMGEAFEADGRGEGAYRRVLHPRRTGAEWGRGEPTPLQR